MQPESLPQGPTSFLPYTHSLPHPARPGLGCRAQLPILQTSAGARFAATCSLTHSDNGFRETGAGTIPPSPPAWEEKEGPGGSGLTHHQRPPLHPPPRCCLPSLDSPTGCYGNDSCKGQLTAQLSSLPSSPIFLSLALVLHCLCPVVRPTVSSLAPGSPGILGGEEGTRLCPGNMLCCISLSCPHRRRGKTASVYVFIPQLFSQLPLALRQMLRTQQEPRRD